ncbi:helix-turn-helix domain-containing protein [Bacillus sp. CGMCC 1.60114]|uniref:helix-turn-helix domain-containing protein n=1 Tax=unclassified Bacillus (in: firmicutes) TaxID=185979 RepID=UPI00362C9924
MDKFLNIFNDALLISEPLYKKNKPLWTKWNNFIDDVKSNSTKIITSQHVSPSFNALLSWLEKKQEGESLIHIYKNIDMYKDEIHQAIGGFIQEEFHNEVISTVTNDHQESDKELGPEFVVSDDYYPVSNSAVYYKLRDGIAKNNFEEDEKSKKLQYPLETKGSNGIAQLSSHKDEDLRLINNEEATRWSTLVNDVMANMDDLTADCLDVITIQWINQAKSPEDFIDFSYKQVLDMCNIPKTVVNNKEYYRAEDKIKVAKRIAALASIFIYLNDDNEVVVLNDSDSDSEKVEVKREVIKRLFVLDSVVLWRHNVTNEYMGIESCRIKPGSFLTSYLYGSSNTTALLSKKALEYNSHRYKYHKRLIRYLTWQWRIRQVYSTLWKPYSIGGDKGLLSVMDIPMNWKPNRIKDQLENVLVDLEKEKVISHWEYAESLDEEQIGKRNWFKNYYSKLSINIFPPEEMLIQMDNDTGNTSIENIENSKQSIVKVQHNDVIETLEMKMDRIRNKLIEVQTKQKISIREIAEELSLSPSTLSRFCNKKTKRMSDQAMEKLSKWYERRKIIERL